MIPRGITSAASEARNPLMDILPSPGEAVKGRSVATNTTRGGSEFSKRLEREVEKREGPSQVDDQDRTARDPGGERTKESSLGDKTKEPVAVFNRGSLKPLQRATHAGKEEEAVKQVPVDGLEETKPQVKPGVDILKALAEAVEEWILSALTPATGTTKGETGPGGSNGLSKDQLGPTSAPKAPIASIIDMFSSPGTGKIQTVLRTLNPQLLDGTDIANPTNSKADTRSALQGLFAPAQFSANAAGNNLAGHQPFWTSPGKEGTVPGTPQANIDKGASQQISSAKLPEMDQVLKAAIFAEQLPVGLNTPRSVVKGQRTGSAADASKPTSKDLGKEVEPKVFTKSNLGLDVQQPAKEKTEPISKLLDLFSKQNGDDPLKLMKLDIQAKMSEPLEVIRSTKQSTSPDPASLLDQRMQDSPVNTQLIQPVVVKDKSEYSPVEPKQLDPQVIVEEVRKAVYQSGDENVTSVRLRLHPPELGQLVVEFRRDDNGMRIEFHTTNQAVHKLLSEAGPKMIEKLQESGIDLGSMDVFLGQGGVGPQGWTSPLDDPDTPPRFIGGEVEGTVNASDPYPGPLHYFRDKNSRVDLLA